VRFAIEHLTDALSHVALGAPLPAGTLRKAGRRLKASVDFGQIEELMSGSIDLSSPTSAPNASRSTRRSLPLISAMTPRPCFRNPSHVLLRPARHAVSLLQSVRESVMELKMQPRSESHQALRNFQIATNRGRNFMRYRPLWKCGLPFQRTARTLRTMDRRAIGDRGYAKASPFADGGLAGMATLQQPQSRAEHYDLLAPSTSPAGRPSSRAFLRSKVWRSPKAIH